MNKAGEKSLYSEHLLQVQCRVTWKSPYINKIKAKITSITILCSNPEYVHQSCLGLLKEKKIFQLPVFYHYDIKRLHRELIYHFSHGAYYLSVRK